MHFAFTVCPIRGIPKYMKSTKMHDFGRKTLYSKLTKF